MRIAICISGEMRIFDSTIVLESFNKFITPLNADIFISTWSHKGFCYNIHHENIFNQRSDIEDDLINRIQSSYNNVKDIEIESYDNWISNLDDSVKSVMSGKLKGGEVITSPPQLYKIFKCNELKKKYELEYNFIYDVVIRIRPDTIFLNEIDFSNTESINHINFGIPGAYWKDRIYDIFFYSNSKNMDLICNTWNNLLDNINNEFDNGLDKKDCCRLLYVSVINNKLSVNDLKTRVCEVYRNEGYDSFMNRIKWINNK